MNLPETLPKKQVFHPRLLKITKDDIFDPLALPSAITMIFCYVSYGVILTTVPDLSDHLQVPNRGIFFMLFTLSSISTRMVAARVSDRLGRVPVLKVSAWLIAGSKILFAQARSAEMLYAASILFGLGNGVFSPAINAWTVDLGHAQRKGRALATMYIALEIAIGGGAVLSGWYFADRITNLPLIFYWAAAMSLAGWVYLLYYEKKRTKI
jgi:MFS family permease